MKEIISVILAAGEGKRMKSKKSKVVHDICGKPLIGWVCQQAKKAGIDEQVVVVGHRAEQVKNALGDVYSFCMQEQQLGTGHAVMQAYDYLKDRTGTAFILYGDTPLITSQTLQKTIGHHDREGNAVTVITADFEDPTGYGRIVRDDNGKVKKIVECKDADDSVKKVTEINSGMYCFDVVALLDALKELKNDNAQGEYYLTDTLEILINKGMKIGAFKIENEEEIFGINDRIQLAQASKIIRERILTNHMKNGVSIIDPTNTYIDDEVIIGMDTVIYPMTFLEGNTVIGEDCIIGPSTKLVNSKISNNVEIVNSTVLNSSIDDNTHVGPFAYIRPNSVIGKNVKIGDFVEIKKSEIGDNTKISHLSYVGDASIGKNVNLGCGVVVVNYDGVNKNKTVVEDNAFIGCNVNLVSPVIVEKGAYVAAGSTITEKVPENSLAIARCRQTVKENWVLNKFGKRG